MTKEQFLARCEAQWESMARPDEDTFYMMYLAIDYVIRKQGEQDDIADELWRMIEKMSDGRQLANNIPLYKAFNFSSRLAHPCQICASDKNDWATRWGWCEHYERSKEATF